MILFLFYSIVFVCIILSFVVWAFSGFRFSNKTVWPLFHYHQQFVEARDEYWQAYKKANSEFARIVCAQLKPVSIAIVF